MTFARLVSCAIAILCVVGVGTAKADTADRIFTFLKEKGDYVGINPDGVEMARYLYKHPENGAEVLGRAAAQDYPFFGLVGAVKAAKYKKFPRIGTFTESKCVTPITAIDAVFSKADNYIDDAGGKADTSSATGYAEQYAKDYAKAQSQQAKEELKEELAKEIPYFGDIALICHFGFNSDFKTEHDIQDLITERVKEARNVYAAFKKKEIVKGAKLLVKMGFSADMACDIVDSALDGAVVGKIPGVSELSNGLCKGFAGKIIGGIIDTGADILEEGAEVVEEGFCAVYDWLGGSCNSDVKVPPNGIQNAKAFCKPYGGVMAASSKTNAPDDYSVRCNNYMACRAKPGKPVQCTTLAQAATAQQKAVEGAQAKELAAKKEFQTGSQAYYEKFAVNYIQPCPDDQCRQEMSGLRTNLMVKAKKIYAANPLDEWWVIETQIRPMEKEQTATIQQAAALRTQQLNQKITEDASQGWRKIYKKAWAKNCPDQSCRDSIAQIVDQYAAEVLQVQAENPDKSSSEVQGMVGRKYKKIADQFVSEYNTVLANKTITDKASGEWEQIFIAKWSKQCPNESCVEAVKTLAGIYAEEVRKAQQNHPEMSASAVHGMVGKKYPKLFQQIINESNQQAATSQSASMSPDGQMSSLGCKKFMGRDKQWLCQDESAFEPCVEYAKNGEALLCATATRVYTDNPTAIRMLRPAGCTSPSPVNLRFTCQNEQGRGACLKFKAGGVPLTCR